MQGKREREGGVNGQWNSLQELMKLIVKSLIILDHNASVLIRVALAQNAQTF